MSDHRAILDDHEQLGILVRNLRSVSHWDPELLRDARVRLQLAGDLQSLHERLRRHFSVEESGNYLEEITARKPSARKTLQALHNEHGMILNQIAALEAACLGKDQGTGAPRIIQERLGQLLDMLKLHELRETNLIKEVFEN